MLSNSSPQHHNGFMPIDALGYSHVRLHVASIQESKVTTRIKNMINMEEESVFKKHAKCSNPNKSGQTYMY